MNTANTGQSVSERHAQQVYEALKRLAAERGSPFTATNTEIGNEALIPARTKEILSAVVSNALARLKMKGVLVWSGSPRLFTVLDESGLPIKREVNEPSEPESPPESTPPPEPVSVAAPAPPASSLTWTPVPPEHMVFVPTTPETDDDEEPSIGAGLGVDPAVVLLRTRGNALRAEIASKSKELSRLERAIAILEETE